MGVKRMKKQFFVLVLLVLFSAFGFASVSTEIAKQYNSNTNKVTLIVSTGWNMIPIGEGISTGDDTQSSDDCQSQDSKSIFVWDSLSKQYLGGPVSNSDPSPASTQKAFDAINSAKPLGYAFGNIGAAWIYRTKPCTVEMSLSGNALTGATGRKILQGWNFITIMPWMLNKKFIDIAGNCNIIKANAWEDASQKWDQSSSSAGATILMSQTNSPIRESTIGMTLVIYAESDCELSITGPVVEPPLLPS